MEATASVALVQDVDDPFLLDGSPIHAGQIVRVQFLELLVINALMVDFVKLKCVKKKISIFAC
jgi:hypothetical protein